MIYKSRRIARQSFIQLRGCEHRVLAWGDPHAQPSVYLHGWADTAATFQFVIDSLQVEHSVVALDWRGFGGSQWRNEPYWFPDYLADLDQFLDIVSPRAGAVLIGHSMGGHIASLYAGVRPERVRILLNLEGFGLPPTAAAEAPSRYRQWLDELRVEPVFSRFASIEDFAVVLKRRNKRLTDSRALFVAREWSRRLPDGDYTICADPYHKLVNPILYQRDAAKACWAECVAPGLLVLGGESEFRRGLGDDGDSEALAQLYQNIEVVTIAAAGHMLHHDAPEELARIIEPWLAHVSDAGPV
jgi:pimeloyl-ACP methyl ester carboxylesterase